MKAADKKFFYPEFEDEKRRRETGFSLVEVTIAMVILMVALLGIFATFTYAINYNAGNNSRAQALAVLQQQVEQMRSAKFTPEITDASLTGGTKARQIVTSGDGGSYRVDISVDNDLATSGIQSTNESTTTLKEVTVTVALDSPTPGWQTSIPATVILRRVRAN
ncbi:MAG: prepilin-type N-terminal cleavage/methylation domain-containing protein [Acidobacteriota bacterium]|nr:prepilin-type N-terminal cleavage/methylation domain-containing protein [Acidobacteriota bacterium]